MLVTMNDSDINRFKVIQDVCDHRIRRVDAADILDLSVRQVQRLMNRLREFGAAGLTHQARGKPSNNRYPSDYRDTVLKLIRDHYSDFSPTLAREKLTELHSLPVSNETLRSWMIADGLWTPHSQRKPKVYQPRYRRDCLGELVQIDSSHHDWFEGRSDKRCLLVFIEDATGRLMNLQLSISDVVTLCSSTILRCHLFIHFLMTLKKRLVTVALSFCDTVTLLHHKSHLSWSTHSN